MGKAAIVSSRRTDDHLLFMMDQTAEWTVNGRAGVTLGLFGSLREALRGTFRYEAAGLHVFAVCGHPGNEVVVFREQVMAPVRLVVFGDGDITGTTDQPSIPPLYLLYLTFLSSDSCEYLLEYRRLTLEERYRRRIRDLYSHTWLHAGKKAA